MVGTRRGWRFGSGGVSACLLGVLAGCAGSPDPGPERDPQRSPDGASAALDRDLGTSAAPIVPAANPRAQWLEVSFPPQVGPALEGWVSGEGAPARAVLAYVEAVERPPEPVVRRLREAPDPAWREALAHGFAGSGRADEATLRALLVDPERSVRHAATVALARSREHASTPERFAVELRGADAEQRAILATAPLHAASEGPWPAAVAHWLARRHRAGRAFGLVGGEPYGAHLLRRLARDAAFLRALLLMDVEPGLAEEDRAAVADVLRPDVPVDVLAHVLGTLGARALAGREGLDAAWGRALREVLLWPWQPPTAAVAIHGLVPRLDEAPWARVARELDAGPGEVRPGAFAGLDPQDAVAACVLVGRLGGPRALALLNAWQHGDPLVQRHLVAARVAAGDVPTALAAWFQSFPDLPRREQLARLAWLARTGVAAKHAALLEPLLAVRDPEIAISVVLATWTGPADPREELLAQLALRDETEPWRGRAAAILFRSATPRLRLLELALVEDGPELLRAWAAWEVRTGSVTGIGFLQAALQQLDDAGALLAARELRKRTGVMGLEDLLLAGLQTTADPLARARLGRLLGELGSERVLERFPERDPALDPAYGAALFGQALQRARRAPEVRR